MTCSSALRRASVVLAAVLLAGCTGGPAPAPSTPVPSAPATSPTPSGGSRPTASPSAELTIEPITTPPPVPANLATPGQVGSRAAVEYFVALYGYTVNSGDTSLIRGLSTPTCEYCASLSNSVEEGREAGWMYSGSQLTIDRIKLHEGESSQNRHLWITRVILAPLETTSPEGERSTTPENTHTSAVLAVWTGDAWKIGQRAGVDETTTPES